jgi:hypothetical protein
MKYFVTIENPLSFNHAYSTFRGHRIMTEEGREYAGEWKPKPVRKPLDPSKNVVNEKIIKSGKNKGKTKIFIEGKCGRLFRAAGIPCFPERKKVIIEAVGIWPDNRAHDLSNLEKLVVDALQNGKFIPNDAWVLWRSIDFHIVKGKFELNLTIYEKERENV